AARLPDANICWQARDPVPRSGARRARDSAALHVGPPLARGRGVRLAVPAVILSACQAPGAPEIASSDRPLSAETRLARVTEIREAPRGMRAFNWPLLL